MMRLAGLEACLAKARKDAAMSGGKRDKTLFQRGKVRQQKPHANPKGAAAVEFLQARHVVQTICNERDEFRCYGPPSRALAVGASIGRTRPWWFFVEACGNRRSDRTRCAKRGVAALQQDALDTTAQMPVDARLWQRFMATRTDRIGVSETCHCR